MNELIFINTLLNEYRDVITLVTSKSQSEYVNDERLVNSSYLLLTKIIERFKKVSNRDLFFSNKLTYLHSQLISLEKYLVNSYKGINALLVYDFYKVEMNKLEEEIKEIISL